ncbi:MAG: hypothetical protein LBM99_00415 [Bacillales bacterium]|jgi:hypothetical protein|nr:hypothetical protein [Bacillales bacterium]
MSKYEKLWEFVRDSKQDTIKLTFDEIKSILGFDIDHSFLNYKKELKEFGYEVGKISLKDKTVVFNKEVK